MTRTENWEVSLLGFLRLKRETARKEQVADHKGRAFRRKCYSGLQTLSLHKTSIPYSPRPCYLLHANEQSAS